MGGSCTFSVSYPCKKLTYHLLKGKETLLGKKMAFGFSFSTSNAKRFFMCLTNICRRMTLLRGRFQYLCNVWHRLLIICVRVAHYSTTNIFTRSIKEQLSSSNLRVGHLIVNCSLYLYWLIFMGVQACSYLTSFSPHSEKQTAVNVTLIYLRRADQNYFTDDRFPRKHIHSTKHYGP